MDWSLRSCTFSDVKKHNHNLNLVDRLSSLPDELLVHILSLLPTKDAAAISLVSTRLRRVFPLITNLDFDASTISHCVKCPSAIEKYPAFVNFVTSVLEAHHSESLTSFRLKVGSVDFIEYFFENVSFGGFRCNHDCLPDLKSLQLSAWISFPLTLRCLRVLDLCVLVREPGDAQLPLAIFTSQTLEVLKLELNIGFDQVLAMPSYSLPSLKVLYFSVSFLSDDNFLPRLLASCPALEDLMYQPIIGHVNYLLIQSNSIRRLCLRLLRGAYFDMDSIDFVYIDTPNLEHFEYTDNLARRYSIIMNNHGLVKAELMVRYAIQRDFDFMLSFQQLINLIAPLSHVQHLHLSGCMLQVFNYVDVNLLKDQLPMFPNMKYLILAADISHLYWDKMLLSLLNCWPALETLVLEKGIISFFDRSFYAADRVFHPFIKEKLELEQNFFRSAHPIPSCCRYHLKTIVIKEYLGQHRECDFIRFFLSHALVLENLIVHCLPKPDSLSPDQILVENELRSLPKASASCLIQVL